MKNELGMATLSIVVGNIIPRLASLQIILSTMRCKDSSSARVFNSFVTSTSENTRVNIQSTKKIQTPYQKIINSKPGRLVRENKVATGASTVAATAVSIGGAIQSDTFAKVAQYGLLPAVGAGVSALGAAAVHDAVVNDLPEKKLKATAKIATGTAAALGGAQVVGMSYDIPVLDRALTGLVFHHGQGLLGAGLLTGAAIAGKAAVGQFQKASDSDEKVVPLALGTGSAVGAVGAGLAGAEFIRQDLDIPVLDKALSGTIEMLSKSPVASVVGGGLLVGGAAVAGSQAVKNMSGDGNDYATAALASGTMAAGLGGMELVGHGLGMEAAQGLFTDNADTVASLSLTAVGAAVTKHAAKSIKDKGISALNTGMLTTGVSAVVGGASLTATTFGANSMATLLSDGTTVAAGAGLGLTSVAFGKQALEATKEGKLGSAVFHGAGAAASGAGSLAALGHGLGIEGLEKAASVVYDVTLQPLTEHVLAPTLEFLVTNPVIGGIGLAASVGAFAYFKTKDD